MLVGSKDFEEVWNRLLRFLFLYPTQWDRIAQIMKAVFIETSEFTEWVHDYLPDDLYSTLQQELMEEPGKGDVMKGCGGLRKIRVADPKRGKGKRGGARIVYLYVPGARWFYMLDIYGKDEKDDLSNDQKKLLADMVHELRAEAKSAVSRRTSAETKGRKS